MKMRKVFGACALLLALTVVGCGKGEASSEASKSSSKPASTQQSTNKPATTTSAAPASTTSAAPADPEPAAPTWPAECPAVIDTSAWTAGTPAANAYGKNYTPLTSADGKVGVKIEVMDYDPASIGTIDGNGKLETTPGNTVTWNVKAPKAGIYQMIMKAKVSSSGDSYSFDSRHIYVTVNSWESQANNYGDRMYTDAGLDHDNMNAFVVALVNLTGKEDKVTLENPYYRMVIDTTAGVTFAEN